MELHDYLGNVERAISDRNRELEFAKKRLSSEMIGWATQLNQLSTQLDAKNIGWSISVSAVGDGKLTFALNIKRGVADATGVQTINFIISCNEAAFAVSNDLDGTSETWHPEKCPQRGEFLLSNIVAASKSLIARFAYNFDELAYNWRR